MKIIGVGPDGSYILTANRTEIANLIGYYWCGQEGCPQPGIGMRIDVSSMYECLNSRKYWDHHTSEIKYHLQEMLKTITIPCPVHEAENEPTAAAN